MKSEEELRELGQKLGEALNAELSQKWDTLERPYPLAYMLASKEQEPLSFDSRRDLAKLVNAYTGVLAKSWVESCLKMHDGLVKMGCLSSQQNVEFASDRYIWAEADVEVEDDLGLPKFSEVLGKRFEHLDREKSFRRAKLMVIETQSTSFAILLNESHGQWGLHIRKLWPDLMEAVESGAFFSSVGNATTRSDLTFQDAVALQYKLSSFSDCVPGVPYPSRPSLKSLMAGSLFAGDADASVAIRYGDGRDQGYLLSYAPSSLSLPEAKDVFWGSVHETTLVVDLLRFASESVEEELASSENLRHKE